MIKIRSKLCRRRRICDSVEFVASSPAVSFTLFSISWCASILEYEYLLNLLLELSKIFKRKISLCGKLCNSYGFIGVYQTKDRWTMCCSVGAHRVRMTVKLWPCFASSECVQCQTFFLWWNLNYQIGNRKCLQNEILFQIDQKIFDFFFKFCHSKFQNTVGFYSWILHWRL